MDGTEDTFCRRAFAMREAGFPDRTRDTLLKRAFSSSNCWSHV
jgi:hypothetical protein